MGESQLWRDEGLVLVNGWMEVHGLRCARTGADCLPPWKPKVLMVIIILLLTYFTESLARKAH